MTIATGDDTGAGSGLTAWRNADAAYVIGELQACDKLLGWSNRLPTKQTLEYGSMTSTRVSGRVSTHRVEGLWRSRHYFQTMQFLFWIMQTAGTPTTEGTPVGYNTHALTIGTVNTPDWHGIHFEREGITSNELRYDLMGFLPSDLVIGCSQDNDKGRAYQEITIPYAYAKTDASDLDTSALTRPPMTVGTKIKTWKHAITGNGAGHTPSGLTYNSNQLEVDVRGIEMHFHRDYLFGRPDTNGYYVDGLMLGWKYWVVLDVVPTGDLLYTVNRTAKESYAGDLDYDFYFTADATNDKHRFLFDKMYMVPFDETNDYNKWFEGYTITLEPLDTTSSFTGTGIDGIDNDGYENP
jgi:hypothetical protein